MRFISTNGLVLPSHPSLTVCNGNLWCRAGRLQNEDWVANCHRVETVPTSGVGAHVPCPQIPGRLLCLCQCTQSLGWRRTSRISASLEFAEGECMYSHRAVRGKDIKMLSILEPGVKRPNFVPRSYTRLNSTYRPLLSCCHSFS